MYSDGLLEMHSFSNEPAVAFHSHIHMNSRPLEQTLLRRPRGAHGVCGNAVADATPAGLINLPVHSLSQRGVLLQWQGRLIGLRYLNESHSIKSLHPPSPLHLGPPRTGRIGGLVQSSVSLGRGDNEKPLDRRLGRRRLA